jgi:hypothetical protein
MPDFIEKKATSLAEIKADPKRSKKIPNNGNNASTRLKPTTWSMTTGNGSAGSAGGRSKILV